MNAFFHPERLRSVVGGVLATRPEWLGVAGGGLESEEAGVTVDSRSVRPGQVFVAIKGERFDGHDFLPEAAAAGARSVIVQHEPRGPLTDDLGRPVAVIRVPDTRRALLRLAQAYRRALEGMKVIGVCGSNGKTTTVRLIDAVLSQRLRGIASRKSFNNDVGVPLTILSARPGHQYLICEIGTNAPGEIAALGSIVEPDVAVIVSIGREHLEGFGSLEGVAREEAAILRCIRAGGAGVATADAPALGPHLRACRDVALVRFGRDREADLRLTETSHEQGGWVRFTVNGRWRLRCPLVGEHNALNALAAVAVGRRFGLNDEEIAAGLLSVRGPEMRWERSNLGGVELVNDAYNANPESMLAAVRTFGGVYPTGPRRRVMVLGDMLELGAAGEASHLEIGRVVAAEHLTDVLVTLGPLGTLIARAARDGGLPGACVTALPEASDDACTEAARRVRPGDVVLLKGSRGVRLERVARALAAESGVRTG